MEYGVQYKLGDNVVVSPVSNSHLAVSIAKSWARSLYPDALPVVRTPGTEEWSELKDSSSFNNLEYKEG